MRNMTKTSLVIGLILIVTAYRAWSEFSNMQALAPLASVEHSLLQVVIAYSIIVTLFAAGVALLVLPFLKKERFGTVIE